MKAISYQILCAVFLFIDISELCCRHCCDMICKNCPKRLPEDEKKCCKPPCDYDAEPQLLRHNPTRCQRCPLSFGYCDPPSNDLVPLVLYPSADEEPPKFLSGISDRDGGHVCGANIIAPHFVMTSCRRCLTIKMRPAPKDSIKVVVAEYDGDESDGIYMNQYSVKLVVTHHGCFVQEHYMSIYDIGLVQLNTAIKFTKNIGPARLPARSGWRANVNRNWYLASLRMNNLFAYTPREAVWYVKVRQLQPELCKRALNFDNETASQPMNYMQHYCTQYDHPSRMDSCQDDYGAALTYDDILFGMLIYKYSCGRARSAGGYVNIANNVDWLEDKVHSLSNGEESILKT